MNPCPKWCFGDRVLKGELIDLLDEHVVAVVTDDLSRKPDVPTVDINQPGEVAAFIMTWLEKAS